ncbi:hypothetical protein BBJ28_00004360 [Nothophytophthora sp. Chile5]|nr:hypothetical protein BBJ28_00004360 [Nothophytophthora sp. Chile5]
MIGRRGTLSERASERTSPPATRQFFVAVACHTKSKTKGDEERVVRFRRDVVLTRLASGLAPHADDAQQTRIARETYTYAALSLLWLLRLRSFPNPQQLVDVAADDDTRSCLKAMTAQLANGEAPLHAIITAGHVGTRESEPDSPLACFWELLPAALARPVVPVHTQWIVYRPLHDRALDELDKNCFGLLRDVLQRPNAEGDAGQLVGIVADQRCSSAHTRAEVTFLGQPTHFPTGAARLHLETGATLWFAALLHDKRFYETSDPAEKPFRLILRPVKLASATESSSVMETTALVQTYASMLEQVVVEHPEQYLWMHDLWNEKRRVSMRVD